MRRWWATAAAASAASSFRRPPLRQTRDCKGLAGLLAEMRWIAAGLAILGATWPASRSTASPPPRVFALTNTEQPLRCLRRLPSGEWQLELTPRPGNLYVIEASTNLLHWAAVGKLIGSVPKVEWVDPASARWPLRFYRVTPRGFYSIRPTGQGAIELVLGVPPGPEFVIETSSDLRTWVPWTHFMSRGPVLQFLHQPPAGADRLFYRARPTGSNWLALQPDATWLLQPTPSYGRCYLVEASSNLVDWQTVQQFIGTDSPVALAALPEGAGWTVRVRTAPLNEVFDVFIILGQSNAVGLGELADREPSDESVWMLGNDYQFKVAYEPLDDSEWQVDLVSADRTIRTNAQYGHSWGLRAAKGITAACGNRVLLIPCAKGSTIIQNWLPGTNRFDRTTLFGSANYRRSLAAPGGLKGIWYYGHESNCHPLYRPTYIQDWTRLITELRQDFGPVPVIYVQLAANIDPEQAAAFQEVAEMQRQMETGSGYPHALPAHHMVVAFDLGLLDYVHLDRASVNTLADRIALATRQHIYGEPINGTGPRLVSIRHPDGDRSAIQVLFDRPINQAFNNYDNQFRVFEVRGSNLLVELPLRRVSRDPNPCAVRLTLCVPASAPLQVSYGQRVAPGLHMPLPNVVKDADGLPAPRFGPLPVQD